METEMETERERWRDRQRDRETDREMERQTERWRDRQRAGRSFPDRYITAAATADGRCPTTHEQRGHKAASLARW